MRTRKLYIGSDGRGGDRSGGRINEGRAGTIGRTKIRMIFVAASGYGRGVDRLEHGGGGDGGRKGVGRRRRGSMREDGGGGVETR